MWRRQSSNNSLPSFISSANLISSDFVNLLSLKGRLFFYFIYIFQSISYELIRWNRTFFKCLCGLFGHQAHAASPPAPPLCAHHPPRLHRTLAGDQGRHHHHLHNHHHLQSHNPQNPLLVITAILGTPALRNLSNGFLLNLAISDLLYVIISCPTTLAQVEFEKQTIIHDPWGDSRTWERKA